MELNILFPYISMRGKLESNERRCYYFLHTKEREGSKTKMRYGILLGVSSTTMVKTQTCCRRRHFYSYHSSIRAKVAHLVVFQLTVSHKIRRTKLYSSIVDTGQDTLPHHLTHHNTYTYHSNILGKYLEKIYSHINHLQSRPCIL